MLHNDTVALTFGGDPQDNSNEFLFLAIAKVPVNFSLLGRFKRSSQNTATLGYDTDTIIVEI